MKLCVTYIYWMLLLTSMVSSGLLFLIVASESIQTNQIEPETGSNVETVEFVNTTLNDAILQENHEPSTANEQLDRRKPNRKINDGNDEATMVFASFESFVNEEIRKEKNVEMLMESLTPQPNLSQGISETGQDVVLTMVDTAAAELKSFANPKMNLEIHSRSMPRNLSGIGSQSTSTVEKTERTGEDPTDSIRTTTTIADEIAGSVNDTDVAEDEEDGELVVHKSSSEESPDIVVVVRAEQKGHIVTDETLKSDDRFDATSDLNDTTARARLVGSDRDETSTAAAAVILDGIVTPGSTEPHEDIPSFSEWAQKRLEEAEKKKTHPNASVQTPVGSNRGLGGMKVRSKNYASPDCGAKIVAANPESRSARSVLSTSRDEYMLNTCSTRIWFVVELCEAIQAEKIELANFELFSSSPKDFSVYVSDRFPTREWSLVGQMTAKDERDIQSFALHPRLFGKFIKVELHSHYGSEHFCPISLFHAYGTSEFEVLETETEIEQISSEANTTADDEEEDSDEEELLDTESSESSRNLFGSARDAVLSIVKKAAEVLVKSSDAANNNKTEIDKNMYNNESSDNTYSGCITPRYLINCENCNEDKFERVFKITSCRDRQLDKLSKIEFISGILRDGDLCKESEIKNEKLKEKFDEKHTHFDISKHTKMLFLTSLFQSEYIIALCNILPTKDRKLFINTKQEIVNDRSDKDETYQSSTVDKNIENINYDNVVCADDSKSPACKTISSRETRRRTSESNIQPEVSNEIKLETETVKVENEPEVKVILSSSIRSTSSEQLSSQIKPTKTLSKENIKKDTSSPSLENSKGMSEETHQSETITTPSPPVNVGTSSTKIIEEVNVVGTHNEITAKVVASDVTSNTGTQIPVQTDENNNIEVEIETKSKIDAKNGIKPEVKIELAEHAKQGKLDNAEQDSKIIYHDNMGLDSLLSELKDLESDPGLQNGQASSNSQPATISTPQQKESVFLRLSNRIKALERNTSLSGQYLEELSRRYKKQVEEMQRSLERALSAMGEESRKGEERENKRNDEIAALRTEIASLSKSVENLLYDRDSWRSRITAIGQHAILICLEVFIVMVILSYCRRKDNLRNEQISRSKSEPIRRRSAENFASHMNSKKPNKRRPSEIVARITGSHHELLIDDRVIDAKKDRKRKRKKETGTVKIVTDVQRETICYKNVLDVIPGGSELPSRRASAIDSVSSLSVPINTKKRPESAPEAVSCSQDENNIAIELKTFEVNTNQNIGSDDSNSSINMADRSISDPLSDNAHEKSENGLSKQAKNLVKGSVLSSPSFMKTALGSRKKRILSSTNEQLPQLRSDNWEWHAKHYSKSAQNSPTIGSIKLDLSSGVNGDANRLVDENESKSGSSTPSSTKKEKKSSLKKMVRKLF